MGRSVSYGMRFSLDLPKGAFVSPSVKAGGRVFEAKTGALCVPGPLGALGLQEKTASG
jgi:hypothetical protein